MPKIQVSVKIKKRPEQVFKIIKDMESFPAFIRDVKSVKIIKRTDDSLVAAWETDVDGAPVNWKEEVVFDEKNFQAKFNLLEGSYKAYNGRWMVEGHHNDSAKLTLEANFDWGIPILELYVGKALEEKARRGLLGMAQAIKKQAEKNV